MLTYSGIDKAKFVKEVAWHRKTDYLAKGTYGEQNGHWKGCAIACSLRSLDKLENRELQEEYSDHSAFETRGLWPEWLARLEDTIFVESYNENRFPDNPIIIPMDFTAQLDKYLGLDSKEKLRLYNRAFDTLMELENQS